MAGAPFCDVGVSLFLARRAFGDVAMSIFVAGATFGDVAVSFFVAGATFGDVAVSLFVAGAAFGEIWVGSRSAKCYIFAILIKIYDTQTRSRRTYFPLSQNVTYGHVKL